MISVESTGSFKDTEAFLNKIRKMELKKYLQSAGQEGAVALEHATPYDTGIAAKAWGYEVVLTKTGVAIYWTNSNIENGFQVVIALQYGYATGTGGYVQGRDYINPAIQPVMDKIAEDVWRVVTSA